MSSISPLSVDSLSDVIAAGPSSETHPSTHIRTTSDSDGSLRAISSLMMKESLILSDIGVHTWASVSNEGQVVTHMRELTG